MSNPKPVEELTYEQAFVELETIVGALEEGEQDLEDSLGLFERGQALAGRCSQLLAAAELKLYELTQHDDGIPDEKPVESEDV
ncbi:MAG: exodeoxyribonuclease VII small subunit [Anaerolineales bacterium]